MKKSFILMVIALLALTFMLTSCFRPAGDDSNDHGNDASGGQQPEYPVGDPDDEYPDDEYPDDEYPDDEYPEEVPNHICVFLDWEITKPATCTENGEAIAKCSFYSYEYDLPCDKTQKRTIPAEHNWGDWVITKEPTCAKSGEETSTCTVCKEATRTRTVRPTDTHTPEIVGGKAPTCTAGGLTAGEKCGVCQKILKEQEEILPTHSIEDGVCKYCNQTFSMGLEYKDAGDFYYVSGIGDCNDSEIFIPDIHSDGKKIVGISDEAFKSNTFIEIIHIPSSITYVGNFSFADCYSLTEIHGGDGVVTIGDSAFANCFLLSEVNISNSVETIGASAFESCSELKTLTIGNHVTNIGEKAFKHCVLLNNITLADGVKNIGANAFEGCSALTEINIPKSISNIEASAFYYCSALTDVTIANGVLTIGDSAFYGCTSITGIEFPNSVNSIAANAFYNCDSLTSVTIGNGLSSIGEKAFFGCDKLETVTLGTKLKTIGDYAFGSCTTLTTINYNCSALNDLTETNNVFDSASKNGDGITVNVGVPVTIIPKNLFRATVSPRIITLNFANNSLCERIDSFAFYGCKTLHNVTIPNSIKAIGESAFYNCYSIETITIPDTVAEMGASAFEGIYWGAFIYCVAVSQPADWAENWRSSPTRVVWDCNNNDVAYESSYKYVELDGVIYEIYDYSYSSSYASVSYQLPSKFNLSEVVIPDTITHNSKVFKVTSIYGSAFENITTIQNVTIGNNVHTIGGYAFSGCTNLKSLTLGESVKTINEDSFSGCSSLESVSIRDSVWYYYSDYIAFDSTDTKLNTTLLLRYTNNYNLEFRYNVVTVDGIKYQLYSDTEAYVAVQGSYQFDSTEIVIPDTITYNSKTYNVTTINSHAFEDCTTLQSITIGNNVTCIENSAFKGCKSLTSVNIRVSTWSYGYGGATKQFSDPSYTAEVLRTDYEYKYSYKC